MRERPSTREQQCGLHLFDLARAYAHDPATPQALALLEQYRVRGAELRRLATLKAAAERAAVPMKLTRARRKLVKLIARRGGWVEPRKPKPPRPRRSMRARTEGRALNWFDPVR
jgi:hypothetical protein